MDNKNFLEKIGSHFGVHEDEHVVELETWTEGSVNMFVHIRKDSDESYLDQFKKHITEFSVDEEVDLHREDKRYRDDFTITESVEDFQEYKEKLNSILADLEQTKEEEEEKSVKKAVVVLTYTDEAELNTFLSKNGTYAEVSAVYEDLDAADIEHIESVINEVVVSEEA